MAAVSSPIRDSRRLSHMPMVIDPLEQIECETIARAMGISAMGDWIAWASDDGVIRLIDFSNNQITPLDSFTVDDAVSHLEIAKDGMIVLGTHSSDLHGHERLGGHRWSHSLGGGCDHLAISDDGTIIACIDGGRQLHILNENGILRGQFSSGELMRLCLATDGTSIAVADDEGTIHILDNNGNLSWSRSPDAENGETISAMTFLHDGTLIICREALGLTADNIPQIALESWDSSGNRMFIEEIDARAVCMYTDGVGALAGLFDGQVIKINQDLTHERIWRNAYSISDIQRHGEDVLVASWFHLYRIGVDGEELWRCEHSGLVQNIQASKNHERIAISGDNQNDYTRENRILIVNPDATPYLLSNDAGIDDDLLPFEDGVEVKTVVAAEDDELYADDGDDVAALLTDEERAMFSEGQRPEIDDDLMAMLDDEIEQIAMIEDDGDDILTDLSDEEFIQSIAPTADAGQDQEVGAGDDGTAIILLDGSNSSPGTHGIQQWAWRDTDSKLIGKTEKIKVKLPLGNHTFTLTITDPMRESSTDTVTVQVAGSARDETFDLLDD